MPLFRSSPRKLPTVSETAQSSLEALRRQMEREWRDALQQTLTDWRGDADQRLDREIGGLFEQLGSQFSGGGNAGDRAGSLPAPSGLEGVLGRQLGKVLGAVINNAVWGGKTKISRHETDRSLSALNQFRLSRSQLQAQQAREAVRGQRNL